MKHYLFLVLLSLFLNFQGRTQDIPHHVSNVAIYDFLDELANEQVIYLNAVVKPYSRRFIAEKLLEAQQKSEKLSSRQQKEITFYLKDFAKDLPGMEGNSFLLSPLYKQRLNKRIDLGYYKDKRFTLTINPILGIEKTWSDSASLYTRWNGAEIYGHVNRWAFYANLRDNYEDEQLAKPLYFTQRMGSKLKGIDSPIADQRGEGNDFSEMRGGFAYSWDWGNIGLVKDHFVWGNNANGAVIFSGRTPSITHIKLNICPVPWFNFNYIHGWLFSEIIDTSKRIILNGLIRDEFYPKYITTNMLSVSPLKNLTLSFGNSIVYTNHDQVAYLLPFMFYKSVDHATNTNNSNGQNAQMFLDISSRQIKHVHLYASLFADEVGVSRMWKKDLHSNFFSMKFGGSLSNFPLKNVSLVLEYTRTNPLTYQHHISVTTYASNNYNLGHYLRDNSQELYVNLRIHPIKNWRIDFSYLHAQHGPNYIYGANKSNYLHVPNYPWGVPFMESVIWENKEVTAKVTWQIIHDVYVHAKLMVESTSGDTMTYTPAFYRGTHPYLSGGLTWGF